MRCIFCDGNVVTADRSKGRPITIPERGVAHTFCAEQDLFSRRVYGSIHMQDLAMNDLVELREMVLAEINAREGKDNDIELF